VVTAAPASEPAFPRRVQGDELLCAELSARSGASRAEADTGSAADTLPPTLALGDASGAASACTASCAGGESICCSGASEARPASSSPACLRSASMCWHASPHSWLSIACGVADVDAASLLRGVDVASGVPAASSTMAYLQDRTTESEGASAL
jgi:hypothetical protein